ncbi:antitermination regulator [Arthrobacter livingstonensis]|uniref:Antitermination regulator n=1 Tax=Arthrobacter livingstonensis TaxID=670078 RepID=A0A2V5LFI9_9MICC|nr:GAF and ANTAR domain-containing protein [Arthrobacter livingstonensis]PYI65120.1 antitermination regulator [Arthrobacter livingstonensis]
MAEKFSPGIQGFGTDLCSTFLQNLPISGVSISAFPGHAPETSICASDATSARIDELQFDLGEGPRWEALRTRGPVAIPNVKSAGHTAWPVFAKALLDLDVSALFVFPLVLGAMDIGIVELYSTSPGPLSSPDHSMALQLTDSVAWKLLQHILTVAPGDNLGPSRDGSLLSRREVHQATGMVLAQTGTSATDALLLLRAHAFSEGLTVREVARDVVSKTLDFTPPKAG